jgi:RNA polymerase sigma factor (sigma-70 family)
MTSGATSDGYFQATIWSTILKAKDGKEEDRQAAMERLFQRYRSPILRHIRERCGPEQAEDLTQEFILRCLQAEFLKQVGPEHGRFRTFIKICIRNFLHDQRDRRKAAKRFDESKSIPLGPLGDDGMLTVDPPSPDPTIEQRVDRHWALSLLDSARERLGRECQEKGRGALFEVLKGQLSGRPDAHSVAEVAERLGLTDNTTYAALHRLRRRLGELIREEVLQTVGTEEDWREELEYLIELLRL